MWGTAGCPATLAMKAPCPPSAQLQERVKASVLTAMGEISAGMGKGEEAAAEMIELNMMARNAPGQEVEMRGPGKEQ